MRGGPADPERRLLHGILPSRPGSWSFGAWTFRSETLLRGSETFLRLNVEISVNSNQQTCNLDFPEQRTQDFSLRSVFSECVAKGSRFKGLGWGVDWKILEIDPVEIHMFFPRVLFASRSWQRSTLFDAQLIFTSCPKC